MSNEEFKMNAAGGQSVWADTWGLQRRIRAVMWLAINGAFAAMLWFGFVEGVEGARNLSLFLVWASFIISWGMLVPDIQKELAKKGRSARRP
ncbi:hypothetical protein CAP31_03825 [Sulfuriferula sp. AH1]|uniref:hypothetical protein n=1 Tax=Sulfuriferula sp. AH1 TaxID=1985873 RepID=UPI000B3B233B|nr:hypothetical protein [Sulfuriferula sp. AH1]ARU30891.1 hypothetical protein CAP31_03825 [Sulfuriferula sp. AH1]